MTEVSRLLTREWACLLDPFPWFPLRRLPLVCQLFVYFAAMRPHVFFLLALLVQLTSCFQPRRDCKAFRKGTFSFSATIGGKEKTTVFSRDEQLEVGYFEGKSDTATIRWINDCEYVVKKLSPRNKAEGKPIHVKILSTTDNSYTFEYSLVGDTDKSKGTATRAAAPATPKSYKN